MSVTSVRMHGILRLGFTEFDALDAVNAEAVKEEALASVGDTADLVVDLSGIEFVDSAGVGVLVALFKTARRNGGRARFCRVSAGVRAVLEIIRLDQIFEIYEDWEDAVRV